VDCYSFIVSDLHRLLSAGLPAHCETFCTSSSNGIVERLHRTLLDEHFRVEGRRTWFETITRCRPFSTNTSSNKRASQHPSVYVIEENRLC
jgi:hypothetical protein